MYGLPLPQNEDQYIGRIDWTATTKQTVFGRYYLTHFKQPGIFNNNLLNTQNQVLDDRVQSFTLGHTYTLTSSLVSSFHLGWTRNIVSRNIAPDVINPNTLGIQVFAPIKNYLYMNISNAFTVACGTCEGLLNSTNGYNVLEDMFWTKGKHHFSFGGNYLRNMLVSDGVNNANGQFNFTGQYTKRRPGRLHARPDSIALSGQQQRRRLPQELWRPIFPGQHSVQPTVHDERRSALGHRAAGN